MFYKSIFKSLPEPIPQTSVATKGVLVFLLTFDKKLNNSPSQDMEYRIRGTGNIQPIKLNSIRTIILLLVRRDDNARQDRSKFFFGIKSDRWTWLVLELKGSGKNGVSFFFFFYKYFNAPLRIICLPL